jgi:epoxyqueuosine reductase
MQNRLGEMDMGQEREIRQLVLSLGADACGFAAIDRFEDAPAGFHPRDIYPDCRAAVVFLKRMPKGLAQVGPRIAYHHFSNMTLAQVDEIALAASHAIERLGGRAVPVPCDSPYEYWDAERTEGRGILSMRHAAVLAGLGGLGKSSLFLSPEYGSMVNIGVVLTDIALASDPLADSPCIKNCHICLDGCPAYALDGVSANQLLCRAHTYETNARGFDVCNCNRCRTLCPLSR